MNGKILFAISHVSARNDTSKSTWKGYRDSAPFHLHVDLFASVVVCFPSVGALECCCCCVLFLLLTKRKGSQHLAAGKTTRNDRCVVSLSHVYAFTNTTVYVHDELRLLLQSCSFISTKDVSMSTRYGTPLLPESAQFNGLAWRSSDVAVRMLTQ